MPVTGEIQGVKRATAGPDFSAFGVETIRVHDHPDFAGLKVFQCVRLNATITPNSCASNYARAECSSVCFSCPIGEHHSATHEPIIAPSNKREFHAPTQAATGLSCIRCEKSGHTNKRLIGRMRLVRKAICVSCFNRQKEFEKGSNSKGGTPRIVLKRASVTVEKDGTRETMDIGLRLNWHECARYVDRAHAGAALIETVFDGETIPQYSLWAPLPFSPWEPRMVRTAKAKKLKHTSTHRVQSASRKPRAPITAQVDWDDWDTPLHKISRPASADESTADGNGLARRRGWLPPLSEEEDQEYRSSFVEETLSDFGYPLDLADFVQWLSAEWPQFESSPIIVKRASAHPAPLYFGKSIEEWASAWGVTAEAAADRLKDRLDDGAALRAMREPVALPPMEEASEWEPSAEDKAVLNHGMAEYLSDCAVYGYPKRLHERTEPDPLDVLDGEGGMQYAPIEPSAAVAEPGALPKVAQPVQQPQRAPEPVKYDMKTRAGRRAFEKALRKEQQQKQREQNELGFPSIANTAKAFIHVMYEIGTRS
ncbi:hypothetical protein [Paraburkholderia heleia]|uniref:hypothetical protein n=1 Tax=Paraburkholderia heleia TaxID=634127 RepID=UPI0005A9D60C|nr:hypothetical protein [Paraburkholderia heleia]